ncbi:hypothetical protein FZC83_02230 [Rossellomorea marisflavi]|uniref:Uncharacterized protein n=1 Tax=Rossellomorea marisflavi TaxID=189381 RepID=A0A5D4S2T1_9BACI|nr:hypothetical protein [Rossellomorea marisflavi]TYS56414.1 hypothetical protein FZC83_02230 [Rossellomorea marisflavi]
MKKLTLITISILTIIILSVSLINKPSTQPKQSASSDQPTQVTQSSDTFAVTSVSNNEYYAELPDKSGVFFTQDDLNNLNQSDMQLTEGDSITVSFEDDETITDIQKLN